MGRLSFAALLGMTCLALSPGCVPTLAKARKVNKTVPETFGGSREAARAPQVDWGQFFTDPTLRGLIAAALQNNQELNIVALEVEVAQSEVTARQGEFLPKLGLKLGAGLEKVGRDTSQGVSDEAHGLPEHLPDFGASLFASWEVDVWKKLRNATKAAVLRYLSSVEGKNFAVTVLVGELANSYFELMALDAQLEVLKQNIEIQKDALAVVRLQKEAAKATELAVKRFEAEVLKNESRLFDTQQRIVETENRINFLVGRFPQHVERASRSFSQWVPMVARAGIPAQLLENRPDVRQAELELAAADLDVEVARASFYPSLEIRAAVGYQAFDLLRLLTTPASLFYNAAADLAAPLLNRKAIVAAYASADAKQRQAVFHFERAILKGYVEVANQLAMVENLDQGFRLRSREVEKLNQAVSISSELFRSVRADYMEVLTTRRDALESQMELIEIKQRQMAAVVGLYQALGGGWR
jgi:NodT family efflux transporter outer membrane factor (OMF) lipoprotein